MKSRGYLFYLVILLFAMACQSKEQKISGSYTGMESYFKEADINDKAILYFYEDKPRMPLPNVYCFDSNGMKLMTPPQCFGIINEYIAFMGDSALPAEPNGQHLDKFLDSIHIMDVYDARVTRKDIKSRFDYYLFVDYLAIPEPGFQKMLSDIVKQSKQSKKKIKLYLVHAFSEKNAKKLASDSKSNFPANQVIQDSMRKK